MRSKTRKTVYWFILLAGMSLGSAHADNLVVQHDIEVTLSPSEQTLHVIDRIVLPEKTPPEFTLHTGLDPAILTPGVELTKNGLPTPGSRLQSYRISLPKDLREITLEYGGKIVRPFRSLSESPGRNRQLLSGTISNKGVFLDAKVAWYPVFVDSLQKFQMRVKLPPDWLAVSQGAGPLQEEHDGKRVVTWRENKPQDDIYLIAAPFQFYAQDNLTVQAQVYLRNADPALAKRYLDATERYIDLYQKLIGPYPYPKFATIENFWETGYGMPSFTLLGSRVIRLPFILHTSFPHEILHNWWGNGVYVDYPSGNWSEGLTAYLADHLLKEQQGKGIDYRRSALQRFGDFVRSENDFPLTEFRSRHTTASQSVGYDKSLMLFHMLRRKLGDDQFIAGLQRFYMDNRFKLAGFTELRDAFESTTQTDLKPFFEQWTRRTGAPAIEVRDIHITPLAQGFQLNGVLEQTHNSAPFQLDVPVIVYTDEPGQPVKQHISTDSQTQQFSIDLPAKPLRLDIDPWYDLFRQLHADEAPPTLSKLFGADTALFVLPHDAPTKHLESYKQLAEQWAKGYPNASIVVDKDLEQLPNEGNIWLLGWENRFSEPILKSDGDDHSITLEKNGFQLAGQAFERKQDSLVVITQGNASVDRKIGLVASHSVKAIPGLARKIPHYGKYSYLVFSGEAPDNRLKGQWEITNSPLQIMLSDPGKTTERLKAPAPLWPLSNQ